MSRLLGNESCVERHQCRLVCPWFEDSNKRSKSSLFFLSNNGSGLRKREEIIEMELIRLQKYHQTQQMKTNKPRI